MHRRKVADSYCRDGGSASNGGAFTRTKKKTARDGLESRCRWAVLRLLALAALALIAGVMVQRLFVLHQYISNYSDVQKYGRTSVITTDTMEAISCSKRRQEQSLHTNLLELMSTASPDDLMSQKSLQ